MSELSSRRFPDEEPEFGDSDYQGKDSYKDLDEKTSGLKVTDEIFDSENRADAKRIREEAEKIGEDPTGKNYTIRSVKGLRRAKG